MYNYIENTKFLNYFMQWNCNYCFYPDIDRQGREPPTNYAATLKFTSVIDK